MAMKTQGMSSDTSVSTELCVWVCMGVCGEGRSEFLVHV